MITIKVLCRHCQSDHLVRNGRTNKGKQKFLCRACGRQSREGPESNGYSEKRKQEILATYREGNSLRGVSRIFGVSRNTLTSWLKQAERADAESQAESARLPATEQIDISQLFSST